MTTPAESGHSHQTPTLDLYADENKPQTRLYYHVWRVELPFEVRSQYKTSELPFIYVSVCTDGLVSIEPNTSWPGLSVTDHAKRHEIYEYLVEWELAVWRRIGPEDSELFATIALDPDFGIER